MSSNVVVVVPPDGDFGSCMAERHEPVLVEALIAKLAIEALDESVLGGLAGLNEVQSHLVLIGPSVEGLANELRAIVSDDAAGVPTLRCGRVECSGLEPLQKSCRRLRKIRT